MTNIEDVLSRLNPKTAQAFRIASEVKNEYLPTPSLGVNMAIRGLGYGRFTVLYGNRNCGKTLFALQACANAQRDGKTVAWVDVEKNFDPQWARRLGVDPDKMIVATNIISIADMADRCQDLITSGVDVLVVDSISQLLPQSFFEDKGEIKDLAKTGQIGTFSKNMGQAINIMNAVNNHTAIILISQVRNQIGSYGASISFMGGKALEHASSTTIKMWRTPSEVIEANVAMGDLILKRPVAAPVTWTIEKNRGPGSAMSNSYDMYHTGPNVGVDRVSEVVTYGIEFGLIAKSGNWLSVGDAKMNGKPAMINYLRENPDIEEKLYGEILAQSIL